ncbi:nucleoside hydrolase [Aquisalibacillus elongatus]|uniref:Pyrimidine-specific ribonucleoside hydrolase n=1 Tax=Aquisalibacillus elongatus TaxID=485577 RepID=A0A3N5BA30_9BACI|nr:nucleoside hydrolase [Aquisalibacillus elongatus]RPF54263.1 pyrimidine-specific ribonucleoside hydrolase [Aquisalibacillus elongatus]
MAKIPVIIDTDPGIDDLMMLLVAITHENLDVRLITTVAGNQTQDLTHQNAVNFVNYLGKNVRVARGLEKPIFKELETAADFHGETGTGPVEFPNVEIEFSEKAIDAMRDVIMTSDEPVTIVTGGPLTNIAALMLAHPEVKSNIRKISIMGGAATGGNVIPTAEFNMYVDPDAAEIVFRSGVPIILSSLDVTRQAYLTNEELEEIKEIGTDLSDKVYDMLKFYQEAAVGTPFHEPYFEEVVRLHDVCAVAYVIDPMLFSGNFYYVTIERGASVTSGTTVVDYVDALGMPPNAYVLYDVNRDSLVDLFIEAIHKV